MDTSRIRTSHAYGEVYPNVFDDFRWVGEHRDELLEKYGRCVILVYHRQIVGKGATLQEAIDDAEVNLPADVSQITPVIEFLGPHHRLSRVRTKTNPSC
jgi:hypothetical protein